MRIFKLTSKSQFLEGATGKIFKKGEVLFTSEARGGALMRRNEDRFVNEIYSLPLIKIINPSELTISDSIEGSGVVIEPKKSVIVDRFKGAILLHKFAFLIGEKSEEEPKVEKPKVRKRKKATKKVVRKAKSAKK